MLINEKTDLSYGISMQNSSRHNELLGVLSILHKF